MNKKRYEDKYLVCLTKGKMYAFEASDYVMSVEDILRSIVPFDKYRLLCWSEPYKKGYNDACHEMLNVLENITKNRRENKDGL